MKKLVFLFSVLLTVSIFATDQLELNKEKMNVSMGGRSTTFEVLRTKKSPSKIALKVHFHQFAYECINYEYEDVWIPPTTREVCEPDREVCRERDGRRICRTIEGRCHNEVVPGYWDTQSVCTEYGDVDKYASKTVKLNFKKAHKLEGNDEERFEVTIKQANKYSKDLSLNGKVIEARGEYKIKQKHYFLGYLNLRFDKK